MIQLDKLSVIFAKDTPLENRVFDNFSLHIQAGEFITVIGGNGAGKSTLLNVIAGDIPITTGQLSLDNVDVTDWTACQRSAFLSRVLQDPLIGSYADLSIAENLSIAFCRGKQRSLRAALNKNLKNYFQERLSEIGMGLENRLNDKMGLLSGGQRQAISLLMATLQPSKILLLDEHTAALDPKMESIVLAYTQRLITEKRLTALMITHCMSQALAFGTRTLVMYQGKIAQDLSALDRKKLSAEDLMAFF